MANLGQLQNIWIISAVLVAFVTLAKHLPWFVSDWGLLCVCIVSSAVAFFRYKLLKRQQQPETRGKIKRIQAADIARVKAIMARNIVDQKDSIQAILLILKRNMEILDSNRHLGSFMLMGPTGTGKTFFAQMLAEGLYGQNSLLSLAMNQEGLRGENVVEILLTSLKQNPYRVVLLDEIDKASAALRATLYHFMESGQLMNAQTGEWYHCPGLVIIATTNAGSHSEEAAQDAAKKPYGLMDHLAANSQMEKAFLARFDGVYWFGALQPSGIANIGIMQLSNYYRQHGIEVHFLCPEAILEIVMENQRFKDFGVRQLIQVVRHKSDPVIAQAKKKGWKEIDILADSEGNFLPRIPKKKKEVA